MNEFYKYGLISLFILLLAGCGGIQYMTLGKTFKYSIDAGEPPDYVVDFDVPNTGFYDAKGNKLVSFGLTFARLTWGDGSQSSSLSNRGVVPASVQVQWFSPIDNQFWNGRCELPQEKIYELLNKGVRSVFYHETRPFSTFTVNVAKGGLIAVWLEGGESSFQLTTCYAQPIELDWDSFQARNEFPQHRHTREEKIVQLLNHMEGWEEDWFKKYYYGFLLTEDRVEILERRYDWKLEIKEKELFELKDYFVRYLNGERYYTYAKDADKSIERGMPYEIRFYVIDKQGERHHFQVKLPQETIARAFDEMSQLPVGDPKTPYVVLLSIDEDLSYIRFGLSRGEHSMNINDFSAKVLELCDSFAVDRNGGCKFVD